MKTKITQRLVASAAICSSVLLLAACEPTGSSTDGTTDTDSPTYGEPPERGLETSPAEEELDADDTQESQETPGMEDTTGGAMQDDEWEEGASQQEPQTSPQQP